MTPDKLRTILIEHELSHDALAKILGIHVTTISRYVRGLRKIPEPTARFILSLRANVDPVRDSPQGDGSQGAAEMRRPS